MWPFNLMDIIEELNTKVVKLQKQLNELQEQKHKDDILFKTIATRLKFKQDVSPLMINGEATYHDLSPKQAIETYRDQDKDFIVLDITEEDDRGDIDLDGTIHIPYSELANRYKEIPNKTTQLLVISKKGLKSILASEYLASIGYLNVNNVSGGFLLWGRAENSLFKLAA